MYLSYSCSSVVCKHGRSCHEVYCHILVPLQISGTPACVEQAKAAVEERCKELEAERQDRILKSFELKAREMFTFFILVYYLRYIMLVLYADFMFCSVDILTVMTLTNTVCWNVTWHCLVEM